MFANEMMYDLHTLTYDAHEDETDAITKHEKVSIYAPTESDVSSQSADESELLTLDATEPDATQTEPKQTCLLDEIEPRFWSLTVLAALLLTAPLVALTAACVIAVQRLFGRREQVGLGPTSNGKVAIVSGGKMTKSFVLIKQLKARGCRVVLVETSKYWMSASRFSNCVDRFVTVPVPEKEPEAYNKAMVALAKEENADLFVPVTSPVASQYEAAMSAELPERCFSWSLPLREMEELDDKVVFCAAAVEMGLPAPTSHRISSHADVFAFNARLLDERAAGAKVTKYIFKNLQYDSMHRLDCFTLPCEPADLEAYVSDIPIDESRQWTVQTYIEGDEFSTCAVVKDGKLLAFTDNEASISCFNYVPARNPRLRHWVETFCAKRHLSGIVCIDFIIEADGTPYAIECNPRASSNITTFYNSDALGAALADPAAPFRGTAEPLPDAVETYWLFSEVWAAATKPGLLTQWPSRTAELVRTLRHKKDAYFDAFDPLPFFAHLYLHLPTLLLRNVRTGNKWAKVDPCIGKMTEENGD